MAVTVGHRVLVVVAVAIVPVVVVMPAEHDRRGFRARRLLLHLGRSFQLGQDVLDEAGDILRPGNGAAC